MPSTREKQWFTSITPSTTLLSGAQTSIQLFNATIHGPRFIKGATVLRTLVDMKIQATAVAQQVGLFYGLAVVNEDARIAGALPEADDSADRADWMLRGRLSTIQASLSDASQWDTVRQDIRSGRTLHSEEDGLLMILDAETSGFTLSFNAFIRILMLMP